LFTSAVLAFSYAVLALTSYHALLGNWSGLASIGNLLAAVFSIPYLWFRAWQLRQAPAFRIGFGRVRWWLMLAFPFMFLLFWGIGWLVALPKL
jgi:hypothetical protein